MCDKRLFNKANHRLSNPNSDQLITTTSLCSRKFTDVLRFLERNPAGWKDRQQRIHTLCCSRLHLLQNIVRLTMKHIFRHKIQSQNAPFQLKKIQLKRVQSLGLEASVVFSPVLGTAEGKKRRRCDMSWWGAGPQPLNNDEKDAWQRLTGECQPICLPVSAERWMTLQPCAGGNIHNAAVTQGAHHHFSLRSPLRTSRWPGCFWCRGF